MTINEYFGLDEPNYNETIRESKTINVTYILKEDGFADIVSIDGDSIDEFYWQLEGPYHSYLDITEQVMDYIYEKFPWMEVDEYPITLNCNMTVDVRCDIIGYEKQYEDESGDFELDEDSTLRSLHIDVHCDDDSIKIEESINANMKINESLLFRDNGSGLADKGYIFTLQELGKLYDEMKDSDPVVSEYKNFSEWMNDTVESGLLEIVDERVFDESLNEADESQIYRDYKIVFHPGYSVWTNMKNYYKVYAPQGHLVGGKATLEKAKEMIDNRIVNKNESLDESGQKLNTYTVSYDCGPFRYDDIGHITVKASNKENAIKIATKKVKSTPHYDWGGVKTSSSACNFRIDNNNNIDESVDTSLNDNVKSWYLKAYPTDEVGQEIDNKITFNGVIQVLNGGGEIYDFLTDDSVIRERVFSELSDRLGVDYDVIYYTWLYPDDHQITIKESVSGISDTPRYYVGAFYDNNYRGLADSFSTDDYDEAENFAWKMVNDGHCIQFIDHNTGKQAYFCGSVDDYEDDFVGAFEDAIIEIRNNAIKESIDDIPNWFKSLYYEAKEKFPSSTQKDTSEQCKYIYDNTDMHDATLLKWRLAMQKEYYKNKGSKDENKFEETPKEYVHADKDLFLKKLQQRGHRKPIVKSEEIPLTDVKESKIEDVTLYNGKYGKIAKITDRWGSPVKVLWNKNGDLVTKLQPYQYLGKSNKDLIDIYLKSEVKSLDEKLIQSDSDKAFKKNVATEIKAGKNPKQAVAIAYSVKRKNESVDDGWEEVSGRNGYKLFRKIEDGKGKWKAQKIVKGEPEGEPFDITYEQALGREPIEDKPITELSKKLGKILLPKRECLGESLNISDEDFQQKLKNELQGKLQHHYKKFGYTQREIEDYIMPVYKTEFRKGYGDDGSDALFIWVGAEVDYEELEEELAPILNKVIQKYDKDAYFEPETTGRLIAVLWGDGTNESLNESDEEWHDTADREQVDEPDYIPDEMDRYEAIAHKMVYDSDGFTTDYTLYFDHNENNYFTVFGDNDLYGPEDSDHDWDFGPNEDEAFEWFEDYEGFVDDDDVDLELTDDDLEVD